MEKKEHHKVPVVRINEILPHNNADSLELIKVIGEYQVVVKKGQFHEGDLAIYIFPDSVVPQTEPFKFIWGPYLDDLVNKPGYEQLNSPIIVPEKKRRITVRKFRKEWSEGLLLPVSDFKEELFPNGVMVTSLAEGTDVSDLLGVTHYDPDTESTKGESSNAPRAKRKYPRTVRGWYSFLLRRIRNFFGFGNDLNGNKGFQETVSLDIPTYDVDALKNHPKTFEEGEQVIVTEKIHGSNARFIFLDGIMYAGSRNLWKAPTSNCIFRRAVKELPWIEEWCRQHEGYVLWGELTPTQGGFDYGTKDVQFFVFDVRTPDGKWLDESTPEGLEILTHLQAHSVPQLYKGPYSLEAIRQFVDGPSTIKRAKHIREGVVIKTSVNRYGKNGRAQMKMVSNSYLEKG